MNKVLLFVFVCCSFGCLAQYQSEKNVKDSIPLFETKALLELLSSDEMEGRKSGTEGYVKASKLVEAFLKNSNIRPLFGDSYSDSVTVNDVYSPNILGLIPGKTDSLIVLGAHLDHIGVKNGKIYNGANDNASGVVALLQIAKYLQEHLSNNEHTVIIAFFTAEEMGLHGSRHTAYLLKSVAPKVSYMLNFEMLGVKISKRKEGQVYLVSKKELMIEEQINQFLQKEFLTRMFYKHNENVFQRSDNYSFHLIFDCPAVTFTNFDTTNYNNYHDDEDEFQYMDVENLNKTINQLATSLHYLLDNNIPIEKN